MLTANPTVDRRSALRYAREMESRIGERLNDALETVFESAEEMSIEEMRNCIMQVLQCAVEASEKETILPDYDTLNSSLDDIRNGRCIDIQEVIDELSSTLDGYGSQENRGIG